METIKRIVMPTDFSESAPEVLEAALVFAKAFDATLEVLHVYVPVIDYAPTGTSYYTEDRGASIAAIGLELSKLADQARAAGVTCQTVCLEGHPASEIVRHTRRVGCNLIVMGTHGRTGIAHVVLGSVAERVVQKAGCPVVTIPGARKHQSVALAS